MTPLLYGLAAAIGWGFADYLAALVARRRGTFSATLGMQTTSLVLFGTAFALLGLLPPLTWHVVVGAILMGALGSGMLAALYKSLALGPIAIVSPVVAANAAVTVILAVLFLGERLSPAQTWAIVATIAGIMLASTDLRVVRQTLGKPAPGVTLALLSLLGFGVLGLLIALYARTLGTVGMVVAIRVGATAFLLAALALWRLRVELPRGALGLVVLIGVLDTGANLAYGLGAQAGYASIVSTGASAYPLIPVVLGIWLMRERIAPNQIVGVVLLVGGLIALGLAS